MAQLLAPRSSFVAALSLAPWLLVAALTGCGKTELPVYESNGSGNSASVSAASVNFKNTASHNDPVDSVTDSSWVDKSSLGAGNSALRVLMTDAPVDAEQVWITFCGVHVKSLSAVDGGEVEGDDDTDAGDSVDAGDDTDSEMADPSSSGGSELTDGDKLSGIGYMMQSREPGEHPEDNEATREEHRDGGEARHRGHHRRDGEDGGARRHEGTWITVSEACQKLDLLSVQGGITEALGVTSLPAGEYGQIRLMLTEASVVVDGEEFPLKVPSGMKSGLKIVGGFTLTEGVATTLVLDFDAEKSIHKVHHGERYILKPVIKLVSQSDQ